MFEGWVRRKTRGRFDHRRGKSTPGASLLTAIALAVAAITLGCNGSPTTPTPPPVGGSPAPAEPSPGLTPPPTPPPTPPRAPRTSRTRYLAFAPRTSRTRYLAFGDSITAGTTSPAVMRALTAGLPQSYPFRLQERLSTRYADQQITVENEGKPGEPAADGVLRLPAALRAARPEVVILLHGINDVAFLGLSGLPRVVGYLNTMARDARVAGANVIICTQPLNRPGGSRAADATVLTRYNQALRDLARGEGALLVDFERDVDVRLIGVDGLHPTEAGYMRMAELLFDTLRTRFETAAPQ